MPLEVMPPDGFLFSIAGLSASLAGLAGLVAGLRPGSDLRPIDAFRLRQIVEFSFGNIAVALVSIPLGEALPTDLALRAIGAITFVYVFATFVLLARRSQSTNVRWSAGWRLIAVSITLTALVLAVLLVAAPSAPLEELLLIALLGRPMLAFLLVLGALDGSA